MPQLIQLRQRIKAIDTIQKITHAMQLIAMSLHLRLRDAKDNLDLYHQETKKLLETLHHHVPEWHNPIFTPVSTAHNPLIIMIGSQKGLCGPFNINLFTALSRGIQAHSLQHPSIVFVGKKGAEYFQHRLASLPVSCTVVRTLNNLEEKFASHIVQELAPLITSGVYSHVFVCASYPATFFMPRQQMTQVLPLTLSADGSEREPLYWQDDPRAIMDTAAHVYINALLYSIIMQSLIAEQSSRFVAMDSATRNAKKLRDAMLLSYNKLRQAKITKEITELSSGFHANMSA